MADRKIDIRLGVKTFMAKGLNKASRQLKAFGKSAARIGAFFAKGFLVAGAAVAGFAVKAVQAFSVQEKAEKSAADAFRAYGEEVTNNVANVKKFAAAIQDETGVGDENIISMAARLKLLGVSTDQLEDAVKGTIALASAGVKEEAAIKMIAMARAGDYNMLKRYIPALRSTNDATEQAAILQDFLTKGYAIQAGQLDTVAGRWNALKGRVGDAMEAIGGAIAGNGQLKKSLDDAGEAVKAMGEKIEKWIAGGGIAVSISTMKLMVEDLRHKWNELSNSVAMVFAAIGDGAETSAGYVKGVWAKTLEIATAAWVHLGETAQATWNQIRGKDMRSVAESAKAHAKYIADQIRRNKELADVIIHGTGIVTKRTEAQLAQREKDRAAHAARVKKIDDELTAALTANVSKPAGDAGTGGGLTPEEQKRAADLAAQELTLIDDLKRAKLDAAKEAVAGINAEIAAKQKLADMTVAQFMAEREGQRAKKKEWQDTVKQAKQIQEQVAAGGKITQKGRDFMAGFQAISGARSDVGPDGKLKGQLESAQAQVDAMGEQTKTLGDIRTLLDKIHTEQDALIKMQ